MAESSGPGRTQADKNRSKQMSRPVAGGQPPRQPTREGARPQGRTATTQAGGPRRSDARGGSGRGGGGAPPPRGRGSSRPAPQRRPPRRSPTALLTWGTAALVVVIVVVLVIVKVTGGSNPSATASWTPVSPTVSSQISHIPASVFDSVGTNSTVAPIYKPILISGQPPLTFTDAATGKQLPGVFFYGAEYCPHCAAERWAFAVALERFGTIKKLGTMTSSASDSPPSIPTFTFSKASYSSPYIALQTVEAYSNEVNAAGTSYKTLQTPTAAQAKLISTYDSNKYFPDIPQGEAAFPLVDFGNKILSEENFAPNFLQGFSRDQIAAGLSDAKNPITQAIIASANMLSASICSIDGQAPASVCTSKGVTAAAKALKLS